MNERVSFAHSNRLRAHTLWLANDDIYGIAESVTSDANWQRKDLYISLFVFSCDQVNHLYTIACGANAVL